MSFMSCSVFFCLLYFSVVESVHTWYPQKNVIMFNEDRHVWLKAEVNLISTQGALCPDVMSTKMQLHHLVYDIETLTKTHCGLFNIAFQLPHSECRHELCFHLSGALWYGGAELHTQRWPLRDVTLPIQPFVTNDLVPTNKSLGNVLERIWVNSKGVGIFETTNNPMMHSYSLTKMCFRPITYRLPLNFNIRKCSNIEMTYLDMRNEFLGKPVGIPDVRMLKSPIWSTWAKYKVDIDEAKVHQYADEILKYGFSNSQLEIDDMFSSQYGEFDFSKDKFKDPKGMVQTLKDKGFRVTVWITPFANLDSPAFKEGMDNSYWLKDEKDEVPALVKWWQGIGGTLDVTSERAVSWYIGRLEKMKTEYGIDSFKFDAGEVTYLPASCKPAVPWTDPTTYTTKYVQAVSKMGPMIEVRCGYKTQSYPVFVRMGDKESRWGYDNGLKTLIPTVLTMGILGYPFILPDMIGGNGYGGDTDDRFTETVLPDRELYIRWLTLTAYLPAMQFSFVPWQYDDEVVKIARTFVAIHEEVVTPILIKAAKLAIKTGTPLIRPLWWIAPEDTDALECDSEFFVGNELLVAPILEQGATERDIYLPAGVWEDNLMQDTVTGGRWLRNYKIELDQVATFNLLQ